MELRNHYFFIINPRAGSGKTMHQWVQAEKYLDKLGIAYETAYTDRKNHATSLAFEAASKGYRRIMAVGGDGSAHEAYNGIMRWCEESGTNSMEFTFGVVPIGSGNDWIKTLRVPHDVEDVISLLNKNSFSPMDVVKVQSAESELCYMANVGGVGFDSRVCQRVNALKESGFRNKMIYLDALRYNISHARPLNISVITDGRVIFSGEAYSVAIGNGRYSGSGMIQVPMASIDDGLIDVTVVPKISVLSIAKHLPKLFRGTLNEARELVFAKCRVLEIVPEDDRSREIIEVDGELKGKLPARFIMTDRQIRVLSGAIISEGLSKERP